MTPPAVRVRRRRCGWGLAALLVVLAVAATAVAFPQAAAVVCPRCYGLTEVAPGLYAAPDPPPERRAELTGLVAAAHQRVADFYGGTIGAPAVLACLDERCYARIGGGGSRGAAVLNRAVMLSPRGLDAVIAAHEMSHVELHRRLGGARDALPQWFDEGLAVVVADDRRYLAAPGAPDRCLVRPHGPLPVTLDDWLRAGSADPDGTYGAAACLVSRWVAGHDSPRAAVAELVGALRAGRPFGDVVR